ncbi:Polysaccharide biosynthesis protein [Musa troglodytarum]|uniref:Polysaccharide biosynthesis protein n=1 Tax=Musa troglodytarum TaxID=320322 RepID=A0A9E7K0N6_9LILI|nr:Polysaccharide biosynthesis protein [Musa troglodytarum]
MEAAGEKKRRVCVTGAGGYLASWLVKLLLSRGYFVHGTVRDRGDPKNAHLKNLDGAAENLQLFKADMLDYNSIVPAIAGCEGVFHVASPVPSTKASNPEATCFLTVFQVEVIAPAVTGTLNVLKACSEAKVKRVVVVSSAVAVSKSPNWPKDKIRDENCWSDEEYCRKTENWYFLSKTLAEREALDFAEKNGLDVVTVCPSLIIGPLLQSTINASSLVLINLLKGVRPTVENKVYYIVDVRDVADALLLVYEEPNASGRHICAPHRAKMHDLVDILKSLYPHYKYPEIFTEVEEDCEMRSVKLNNLGWKCRTLQESLVDTIECHQAAGLLDRA